MCNRYSVLYYKVLNQQKVTQYFLPCVTRSKKRKSIFVQLIVDALYKKSLLRGSYLEFQFQEVFNVPCPLIKKIVRTILIFDQNDWF